MPDFKQLAAAWAPDIPAAALDKIEPSLQALEAAFRPLTAHVPLDAEPAYVLKIEPEPEPGA
ncbi:MAG: hypothetical protein R2762_05950 [Bryobacteraceae bacterium]